MSVTGDVDKFIRSWDDEEQRMFSLGATIEGIVWFRHTLNKVFKGDKWRMFSEFPATASDAFQSTGRRYFPVQYVNNMRENNRKPELIGDLFAEEIGNEKCLNNIEFKDVTNGALWVWSLPDKSVNVSNRYAISIDVGGRHENADLSVIRVLDRYALMYADVPEVVAEWVGRMDYDLVAWKGAQIAYFYNKGLLIPESNYFDNKGEYDEGDHMITVLDTISEWYENLYTRTMPDRIKEGIPAVWGFHTNKQTKPMILSNMLRHFRERGYIEPSHRLCDEADSFEQKPNGTTGAVDGAHDDNLMSTAILLWVSDERMDPPKVITLNSNNNKKPTMGASSF